MLQTFATNCKRNARKQLSRWITHFQTIGLILPLDDLHIVHKNNAHVLSVDGPWGFEDLGRLDLLNTLGMNG